MRGDRFQSLAQPRGRYIVVGNALYHTVGDREQAVRQLVIDMDSAYADLYHDYGAKLKGNPVWVQWWTANAAPMFAAWAKFKSEQLTGDTDVASGYVAYGERFKTDWSVYEDWHKRLLALRRTAQLLGIPMTTPLPTALPTTIVEDVEDLANKFGHKVADKAGDVWDLAKVAIYGGLGLVGVIALTSVVSNLKSGKDPAANYMALARRR